MSVSFFVTSRVDDRFDLDGLRSSGRNGNRRDQNARYVSLTAPIGRSFPAVVLLVE